MSNTVSTAHTGRAERISAATRERLLKLADEYEEAGAHVAYASRDGHDTTAALNAFKQAYGELYRALLELTDVELPDGGAA